MFRKRLKPRRHLPHPIYDTLRNEFYSGLAIGAVIVAALGATFLGGR